MSPLAIVTGLGLELGRGSRDELVLFICPDHKDRKPSARGVRKDGAFVWTCGACGAGGDILTLVASVRGLDPRSNFRQVVQAAADLVGVTIDQGQPRRPTKTTPRDIVIELAQYIDRGAEDWLAGRDPKAPDPRFANATISHVVEALDLLALADAEADALMLIVDEDAELDAQLEAAADRWERWQKYPVYGGPIHTAKDGPPPRAYRQHVAELVSTGFMVKPKWFTPEWLEGR